MNMVNIWQDMKKSWNKYKSELTLFSTYAGILSAYFQIYKIIMSLDNDTGADSP